MKDIPIVNPLIVLREKFDDLAILFDPETGNGYGLNPVGVFIWKRLDGCSTIQDVLVELRESCENMPEDAEGYIKLFVQNLVDQGLAGYEL